jgi:2-dehydro-3-deoxyphosphogluconate aldolase/(4S)-4-hydroxy-2-oxoglutarate aldolase
MTAPQFTDFYSLPLVGILRGGAPEDLPHIIRAVRNGGIRFLEITMNTPGAEDQIRSAVELSEGVITIGAGTVTSQPLLDRAIAAGAKFIVTPAVVPAVIGFCEDSRLPVFPGALTPTEICTAWETAPNLIPAVKIFPGDFGGPSYIRALKGPFPQIPLMPTGGVDLASLPAFLDAGAIAFGIGSPLFQKSRLQAHDWTWLENQVRAFVGVYKSTAAKVKAAKT